MSKAVFHSDDFEPHLPMAKKDPSTMTILQRIGLIDREGAMGASLVGLVASIVLLPAIYYVFKLGDSATGTVGVLCFGYLALRIYRSYHRVDANLPFVFAWASMFIAGLLISAIGTFALKEDTFNIREIEWKRIQRIGYLLVFSAMCFLLGPVLYGQRYFGIGSRTKPSRISTGESEQHLE